MASNVFTLTCFFIRALSGRGHAILLIEHDIKMLTGLSDFVTVLDFAVKIAEGRPEQLQKNQKTVDTYLGQKA